jgi:hypothetical protein
MSDEPEWFAPKRFGYGAGLPISWQGWVLTLGFVALAVLGSLLIPYSWIGAASVLVMLTAGFLLITARTTKGGWRWRWGDDDRSS